MHRPELIITRNGYKLRNIERFTILLKQFMLTDFSC